MFIWHITHPLYVNRVVFSKYNCNIWSDQSKRGREVIKMKLTSTTTVSRRSSGGNLNPLNGLIKAQEASPSEVPAKKVNIKSYFHIISNDLPLGRFEALDKFLKFSLKIVNSIWISKNLIRKTFSICKKVYISPK